MLQWLLLQRQNKLENKLKRNHIKIEHTRTACEKCQNKVKIRDDGQNEKLTFLQRFLVTQTMALPRAQKKWLQKIIHQ